MRLYRIQSCSISTGKYSTFVASKCKHSMQPNEHSAHVAPLGYTTTKIFIVISSGGATKYDILSMIEPTDTAECNMAVYEAYGDYSPTHRPASM